MVKSRYKNNEIAAMKRSGSDVLENDAAIKSPLRNITNFSNINASTPKKAKLEHNIGSGSPVTPRCNIKLLTSIAAGLDYVEKSNENDNISLNESSAIYDEEFSLNTSRKGKSIAVICKRFISNFPEYPKSNENLVISITEAAVNLGVEKRRIYDIVNILESVQIVKKTGKDQCIWCGKNKLIYSLSALKTMAIAHGFDGIVKNALFDCNFFCNSENNFTPMSQFSQSRKEKSLNALTQQFLSLYITEEKPLSIPLETAAHIIVGNLENSHALKKGTEFKTKVRRLYDIANVLVTLQILKRNPKQFGKPTFVYVGPNLFKVNALEKDKESESLKKQYFENLCLIPTQKSGSSEFCRTKSENWDLVPKKRSTKFIRHSSLQEICAVASAEREKLVTPAHSFSLENSNDSCFSFLSSASSLNENVGDRIPTPPETPVPIKQSSTNNSLEFSFDEKLNASSPSEKNLIPTPLEVHKNDEIVSNNDLNSLRCERIVKLSQEQQATLSAALNLTFEDSQISLLVVPNGNNDCEKNKEDHSKEKLDKNKKMKIVLPKTNFSAEVTGKKNKILQPTIIDITDINKIVTCGTSTPIESKSITINGSSLKNQSWLKLPLEKKLERSSSEKTVSRNYPTVVLRKLNPSSTFATLVTVLPKK